MLSTLPLRERYRSDYDSLLRDFYIPCFGAANRYDRAVGFFTASSLSLAINGIHDFIANKGHIRLVVSPYLNQDDIRAISAGYEDRENVVERALIRTLLESISEVFDKHLSFVSWLIEHELLDIKVAITTSNRQIGSYHEKLGVFGDRMGNNVAFTGSANETVNGMIGNFERIDVFRSWKSSDEERLPGLLRDFDELWSNITPGLRVLAFPEAARNELLRVAPPTFLEPGEYLQAPPRTSDHFELRKIELKARQLEAVEKWTSARGHGILEMATGTGKTISAIACAASIANLGALIIAVPTVELVYQWAQALKATSDFPIPIEAIGESRVWLEKLFRKLNLASNQESYSKSSVPCIVGTYDALADEKVSRLIADAGGLPMNSLLICDEVHNAGASTYRKVMRDGFTLRLGLSATPVRKYDEDGNEAILDYFGDTVYAFGIAQAINAGILAKYDYHVFPVYLTVDEYAEYQELSRKIAATPSNTSLTEELQKLLLIKRANILKSASGKTSALEKIIADGKIQKALVYAATIDEATEFSSLLARSGIRSARYSSVDNDRRRILNDFSRNRLDALVSINCLDEGVDVPSAATAVILASDASERQFIQRRGRVLRTAPDKTHAIIYDVLVLPPDPDKPIRVFETEIRRIAEFAKHSRNPDSVAAHLAALLLPYGFRISQVMTELGR